MIARRRLAAQALIALALGTAGALLLLVTYGGPAAAAQAQENVVEGTAQLTWEPAELQIAPGDTVTFTVAGAPPHPVEPDPAAGVTFDAAACTLDKMSTQGASCQITFSEPGTYPYVCTVHVAVGMKGTIIVGEGGDATVTQTTSTPTPTPTPTALDTPAAATTPPGEPGIYYAGWGLLAIGGLLAMGAVVGYLRFAPDFRQADKK